MAAAFVALAGVLAAVPPSTGAPPAVRTKQAQARAVLAQVRSIDLRLGHAVEAWDGARYRLGLIRAREHENAVALARVRRAYRVAQRHAANRLVTLYVSGEPTALDVVLGSTSFSQLLDRVEAADAAAALDDEIARQVATLRGRLAARGRALARERRRRAATVATLGTRRRVIESELAKRRALFGSIKREVGRLHAQERARQQRLLVEARARLARQQRLLERQRQLARARARHNREDTAAPVVRAHAAIAPPTTIPTPSTPAPPLTTTAATTTAPSTAPPAPPPPAPAPPAVGYPEAASIALAYLGTPYRWGGAAPGGFDCSGLVTYVYARLGISLPHFAAAQYQQGTSVARGDLQPGDLVFFDGLSHVGIYIGGDQFVHAPHTGDVVKISSLEERWYAATYVGARRI